MLYLCTVHVWAGVIVGGTFLGLSPKRFDPYPQIGMRRLFRFLEPIVLEAEIKVSADWFLLEALRENPVYASLLASSGCWQSFVFLGL